MPSVEKLIEKMKNQPNGIRPDEVDKVLAHKAYRPVRQDGSHRQYLGENGDLITIPQKNPVKSVYVKDILKRIGEKK